MLNFCDLGCMQVGLKSLEISVDYRVYMGSSSRIWSFRRLFLYLCSYKLVGSVTGLSTKLMKTMANSRCTTYNEFISDALTQENHNNMHAIAKGRKRAIEAGASRSSQSKAPITARPQFCPPTPKFRPPPPKAQNGRPQKVFRKSFTIALSKGNSGQGNSTRPRSNQPCYNYNQVGHWAKECPTLKKWQSE